MGRSWILSMASIPAVAKPSQEVPQGLEGHQTATALWGRDVPDENQHSERCCCSKNPRGNIQGATAEKAPNCLTTPPLSKSLFPGTQGGSFPHCDPVTYAEVNMKWRSDTPDSTPKITHSVTCSEKSPWCYLVLALLFCAAVLLFTGILLAVKCYSY